MHFPCLHSTAEEKLPHTQQHSLCNWLCHSVPARICGVIFKFRYQSNDFSQLSLSLFFFLRNHHHNLLLGISYAVPPQAHLLRPGIWDSNAGFQLLCRCGSVVEHSFNLWHPQRVGKDISLRAWKVQAIKIEGPILCCSKIS